MNIDRKQESQQLHAATKEILILLLYTRRRKRMNGVSLSLGGAKKRPVAAAAFGEEPEERGSATAEIRDLEDGRSKAPRVISMKDTGGWHKGRLGKGSNAAAIMEHVKKGGTVTADDDQAGKKAPGMLGSHAGGAGAENDARAALMRDAARAAEQAEGEEQTLGLTIEGTTDKASAAERVKAAAARRKEQEDKIAFEDCGEETKLTDYDEMPIAEFGMALMRGMGWKDGSALGSSRKGILEPVEIKAQPEGLGLGAVPSENEDAGGRGKGGRRFIPKPGQEKDHREEAKERIRKEAAARMGTFQVGMEVAIVSGRHRGLTGKISYSYAHEIMVKLSASGEEVTVDKKDLDSDVSKARDIKTREEEQAARDKELRHRRHEEEQAPLCERTGGDRGRRGRGQRGQRRRFDFAGAAAALCGCAVRRRTRGGSAVATVTASSANRRRSAVRPGGSLRKKARAVRRFFAADAACGGGS